MQEIFTEEIVYTLRICGALLCGAALGYERKRQMKTAGVATHAMVAATSALMMIVSKYGFFDVLYQSSVKVDPSRIASSVVTAISFLGAGVIFNRKINVSGLTTSAGLWMTVGIGISIGAGMYWIGGISTIIVLIFQFLVHLRKKHKSPILECIEIIIDETKDIRGFMDEIVNGRKFVISNMSVSRMKGGRLKIKLYGGYSEISTLESTIEFMRKIPEVVSVKY